MPPIVSEEVMIVGTLVACEIPRNAHTATSDVAMCFSFPRTMRLMLPAMIRPMTPAMTVNCAINGI